MFKTVDGLKSCDLCKSSASKFYQICKNGCIGCDNCAKILGEDWFVKKTRRGDFCTNCKGECLDVPIYNRAYTELATTFKDVNSEITHGLQQIKNHGYVTEGMANGEVAPDWVPIKKDQAIKEAMNFLKNDPNLNFVKPKRKSGAPDRDDFETPEAYSEAVEEYDNKKLERAERAKERKRKLENYDALVEELEECKKRIRILEASDYQKLHFPM
tara:strand:+ start:171 stop:812 length:642 start_codon:yes stop_codon:yes gene_type:complete